MNSKQSKLNRRGLSGQAFFKWLAIIALLAAAGAGYALMTGQKAHEAELEKLRAEHQQELARQAEEVEKLRNENKDIERLRAEGLEVAKLRGEAAQLRNLQREQQKLQDENQKLRTTVQEYSQVRTENSALQTQNQQLQGALAERANIAACIGILKTIEQLKLRWATELRKLPTDVPLDSDLFGPGKFLQQKPVCPSGGVYNVGPIQAKPTCSAPGHVYQ